MFKVTYIAFQKCQKGKGYINMASKNNINMFITFNTCKMTYCIRLRVDVLIPGGVLAGGVSIAKGEYNFTSL